ncbi:MAG: SGNH/GDSL hydrolase family protein [Vulcanococcus sp.]
MDFQLLLSLMNVFDQLYVFGDSLTDYGSEAAYLQKTLLAPTALPAWSGVSFSNANTVSQLDLRELLGLSTPSQAPPPALGIPAPYYEVANTYVAIPGLGNANGPSFAIGGATSGTASLYDFINVPGTSTPLSTAFPELASTGVQNQILQAIAQGVKPASNQLTLTQGGSNDLLIAYIQQNPDIEGVLATAMANMQQNLTVQLRAMGVRQLMSFGLADFRGVVDGVPYEMPFLSGILLEASKPDAPAWIKPWKAFVDAGGLGQFQQDYAAMIQDLQKQFPYAAVLYQNPEFGANWSLYGQELGNFASYGISKTFDYAQRANQPLTVEQTNAFLYFDQIHNPEGGQAMAAKGMALTLQANQNAIAAAALVAQIYGNSLPNRLLAGPENTQMDGRAGNDLLGGNRGNDALSGNRGNDRIIGEAGTDWIRGGKGSDRLSGGGDADFFAYQAEDVSRRWRDTITDFNASEGDRLGLNAVLDGIDPYANSGWDFIGSQRFSETGVAELRFTRGGWLLGDANGDGRADLRIQLLGLEIFDTAWIS